MTTDLIDFQLFFDEYAAINYAQKLELFSIDYVIKKLPQKMSGEIYLGSSFQPEYVLQIKATDYVIAHKALEAYYEPLLNDVEADYYLLSYNRNQLINIVKHPQEWSHFDYQLALKLLKQQNINISQDYIDSLREEAMEEKKELNKNTSLMGKLIIILLGLVFLSMLINVALNY